MNLWSLAQPVSKGNVHNSSKSYREKGAPSDRHLESLFVAASIAVFPHESSSATFGNRDDGVSRMQLVVSDKAINMLNVHLSV